MLGHSHCQRQSLSQRSSCQSQQQRQSLSQSLSQRSSCQSQQQR
jgi:hypothetical protein